MAIMGTAGSCTSQASMPPGLTTRSMVVAKAGAAKANSAAIASAKRRGRRSEIDGVHVCFSFAGKLLTR